MGPFLCILVFLVFILGVLLFGVFHQRKFLKDKPKHKPKAKILRFWNRSYAARPWEYKDEPAPDYEAYLDGRENDPRDGPA
jgi:hypothetical protein